MNKDLKLLIALQEIDIHILELENSKREFPKTVEELKREIETAGRGIVDIERKIDELQKEKDKISVQVTDVQQLLDRSQERFNAIKTNKEYDAIHAEIEAQKHLINTNTKRLQKITQDITALHNGLTEKRNEFEKKRAEHEPHIKELEEKIATIDQRIAGELEGRRTLAASIALPLIRAYEHIKPSRKNGKVCSIVSNNTRNCTVCFQHLSPQVMNQVRKATEVMYCPSCGSILVWSQYLTDD